MRSRWRLAVLLLLALAAGLMLRSRIGTPPPPTRSRVIGDYTFVVDASSPEPWILSLHGTAEHPQPGDVVHVAGYALTLGEERRIDLTRSPRAKEQLVIRDRTGGQGDVRDGLQDLSEEAIRQLRGIRIEHWSENAERALDLIDLDRTCVTISHEILRDGERALPELPSSLRYLIIDDSSIDGFEDLSSLQHLDHLRLLVLRGRTKRTIDARHLVPNPELAHLDLDGSSLLHAEALEALTGLRHLDLSRVDGLTDLGFVRGMPSLRTLEVLSTGLPDEAVEDFRRAHPECSVAHRWSAWLFEKAEEATRIRVRSGGTDHRGPGEQTLFEITDPQAIRGLLYGIDIDESRSGTSCAYRGSPTIEFHAGDALLAALSVHHGRVLRWPGQWPGDGLLTHYSADYLTEWLAEHGIVTPQRELERALREDEAAARRERAYTRIVPIDIVELWVETESGDEVFAAIADRIDDAVERTALYLRLYGCDAGSWNRLAGWDERLAGELAVIDHATMATTTEALGGDEEGTRGIARLILGDGRIDLLDDRSLARVLPELAEVGLTHGRRINRKRSIFHLGRIGSAEAIAALRACLRGEIEVQPVAEDELVEPPGTVIAMPVDSAIDSSCSDRAHSALVLAELGDRASLPVIEMLAEQADGEDRVLLGEALTLLAE